MKGLQEGDQSLKGDKRIRQSEETEKVHTKKIVSVEA